MIMLLNSLITTIIHHKDMFKFKKGILISQIVILCLLGLAITFVAIPSYLSQQWSWTEIPFVAEIAQMKKVPETKFNFAGWTTVTQKKMSVHDYPWSFQLIEKPGEDTILVALKAQKYFKDRPEVEWSDLEGLEQWKSDYLTTLKFPSTIKPNNLITARWFQAWNDTTYAVVQWYAWPGGGSPKSSRWFLADQKAQLRGERVGWVAVSIKIPMEALGSLKDMEPLAKSLSQEVQKTLETEVFIAQ